MHQKCEENILLTNANSHPSMWIERNVKMKKETNKNVVCFRSLTFRSGRLRSWFSNDVTSEKRSEEKKNVKSGPKCKAIAYFEFSNEKLFDGAKVATVLLKHDTARNFPVYQVRPVYSVL